MAYMVNKFKMFKVIRTTKNIHQFQNRLTYFTHQRLSHNVTEMNVIKSPVLELPTLNFNVHELLLNKLDKWAEKASVLCSETGRFYTYAQSDKLSSNLAQYLCAKMNFKKGDIIAVMLPNIPEYLIIYLGLSKAGIVVTTINPLFKPNEIERQIQETGAKAVITLASNCANVENGIKNLKAKQNIHIIAVKHLSSDTISRDTIDFSELCEYNGRQIQLSNPSKDDLAVIAYSSGTTGLPKGVKLLHRNIVYSTSQLQHELFKFTSETTTSHQDVVPMVLPFYHIYGMVPCLFNCFSEGCKSTLLSKFRSESYLNMLEKYSAHVLFVVPPIFLMLINNENIKKHHLSQVKLIVSGAAPLGASDMKRFEQKFGDQIIVTQAYGMTELSGVSHATRLDQKYEIGSVGTTIPETESRIVSIEDDKTTLGPLKSGHLQVRGPQVMDGYLNNPEATAETIDENGWLNTGDIGYYNENGNFFITDRIKELIKVKGLQVAPAELEAVIREHPDVEDAAVIGVNHTKYGEVPKAFVVSRKGTNLNGSNIQEYVKEKVAEYKQLSGGVVFIDSIPKTPSGKILRKQLKDI